MRKVHRLRDDSLRARPIKLLPELGDRFKQARGFVDGLSCPMLIGVTAVIHGERPDLRQNRCHGG